MRLQFSKATTLRSRRAFTLLEVLIVSTTLVVIVGSVIMCNLFGLSMAARQEIWMGASDDAAQATSMMTTDIRSAITMAVGSYSGGTFTTNTSAGQISGNALLIYTTTNTLPWTLYYYDTTSNNLVRTVYYGAGLASDYKLVSANPITNDSTHPIFTAVDYTGTPLTNTTSTNVNPLPDQFGIGIYLSFIKLQNPQVVIESGSVVDLYQITTTVNPRMF